MMTSDSSAADDGWGPRLMPWQTERWAVKCPIRVDWTPNPVTRRLVLSWPFTGHGLTIWIGPRR